MTAKSAEEKVKLLFKSFFEKESLMMFNSSQLLIPIIKMNLTFYPQQSIKIFNILIAAVICLVIAGCSKDDDDIGKGGITGQLHALRFTDSFKRDVPEVISVNSDAQTIELHLKGVEGFDITKPIKLACGSSICSGVAQWDEEKNDWVDADSESQVDSFYHIEEMERNEESFITVSLNDNNTDKERKILLHIASYNPEVSRQYILVGEVEIIQLPASSEAEE